MNKNWKISIMEGPRCNEWHEQVKFAYRIIGSPEKSLPEAADIAKAIEAIPDAIEALATAANFIRGYGETTKAQALYEIDQAYNKLMKG